MTMYDLNIEKVFKAPFGVVSNKMMRDKRLPIQAKALCAYLSSCTSKGFTQIPNGSVDIVCDELNISAYEFHKYINILAQNGYLETR